jgi:hypothetical protein
VAEPISWLALQAIKALVQSVSVINGYYTDMGAADIVLDRSQVPEGEAPFVLITATDFTPIDARSGPKTTVNTMDLVIEFAQPMGDGVTDPELIAHRGRADLVRVLKTDLRSAPAMLHNLQITSSRIGSDTDEAGSALVIAQVSARVDLTESKSPAT